MKAMGLDLSTVAGIVVAGSDGGSTPPVCLRGLEVATSSKEHIFVRAGQIVDQVLKAQKDFMPDIVVMEGYGYANSHTLVPLVEIGTLVRKALFDRDINAVIVTPTCLKKFITSSGNAKKEQIMMEVYKRWGYTPKTNNVADAFGLAMYGLAFLNVLETTQVQKDCLKKHTRLMCN
jgi:crossover junction endodeoxyribonuclease RuvC